MSIIAPVIVTLKGDWDLSRRDELHRKIEPLLQSPLGIIDMSEVQYVDTSVLSEFVKMRKERMAHGFVPVAIVISSPMLRKIFRITQLDELWTVCETLQEALAKLRAV